MTASTGLRSGESEHESVNSRMTRLIRVSSPLTERAGVRKSRVGGWRILFAVDRDAQIIHILTLDTRGQVYKHS